MDHYKFLQDCNTTLEALTTVLEPDCTVVTFTSAESCIERLATEAPDMFLLDITLPGIDGYRLCRQIKDDPALSRIPVTFISSHDTIDARLAGYDAGGEDFIVKPFAPEELLRKLKVAQGIVRQQSSLKEQADAAELLSSLVMASMDETGILLQFMSKLIAWDSPREIAEGALELLRRYRLDGVAQLRTAQGVLTLSAAGENLPLEMSVIDHVRNLGRIFEFRNRGVHNFERVTLMINNLPLNDPEYCGRLRDHLSVAAQGIDSRLTAIETDEANRRGQAAILQALESVSAVLASLRTANERNTAEGAALTVELQESLANSFLRLGLSEVQERFLQEMIGEFMARMAELQNRSAETQSALQALSNKLGALRPR